MDIEATRDIDVASEVIAALIEAARPEPDRECCGLLVGSQGIAGPAGPARIARALPATNVHPQPSQHFEIDPAALIAAYRAERQGGPALIGFYHSHPNGHPRPSATDCEHAGGDGRVWAIIAGDRVHFWRDMPQGFQALTASVIST